MSKGIDINKNNQIPKRRVARAAGARSNYQMFWVFFLRVDKTSMRRGEMEVIYGGGEEGYFGDE